MKLSREELNEIIERDVPGTRLVETSHDADPRVVRAPADLDSPDIDTLREKFLGRSKKKANVSPVRASAPGKRRAAKSRDVAKPTPARSSPGDDDDDVEIVTVTPKRPVEALDRGARPKAVVVSSKAKKVIGRQG